MSGLDLKISYHVARYLTGEESLADFRRWFLPAVWEAGEPENDEVSQLANRIELRLAEFLNGHWTENDLRMIFRQLIPSTGGVVADLTPFIVSGAGASALAEPLRPPSEFVLS